MKMAALLGVALLINPCSFWDIAHYQVAQDDRAHAGAMHDYAMVEEDNCPQATGPCAAHTVELVRMSEEWAIHYREELERVSPECRDYIEHDKETEAR